MPPIKNTTSTLQDNKEALILTASQCKISTIIWDLDWRNETEIRLLAKRFKSEGPTTFHALCCEIGLKGGFLRHDQLEAVADQIYIDLAVVESIVEECTSLGILEASEYGLTSRRVQREIEKLMRQRLSAKARDRILIFPWTPLDPGFDTSGGWVDPGLEIIERPQEGKVREGKVEEGKVEDSPDATARGNFKLIHIDDISFEQLQCAQTSIVVERAILLAEAHIERKKGTPEYSDLKRQALNGGAFLASWALSEARKQLASEQTEAARLTRAQTPFSAKPSPRPPKTPPKAPGAQF